MFQVVSLRLGLFFYEMVLSLSINFLFVWLMMYIVNESSNHQNQSNAIIVPKYWCLMTGCLPNTYALYILGIPPEIFYQLAAPEIL